MGNYVGRVMRLLQNLFQKAENMPWKITNSMRMFGQPLSVYVKSLFYPILFIL